MADPQIGFEANAIFRLAIGVAHRKVRRNLRVSERFLRRKRITVNAPTTNKNVSKMMTLESTLHLHVRELSFYKIALSPGERQEPGF